MSASLLRHKVDPMRRVVFRACNGPSPYCDAGCVRCDGDCERTERIVARLQRMAEGYFG